MASKLDTPQAIFASNVRCLRKGRGWTQEEAAWAARLHQTALARIESGERKPTLNTIFKLAAGLEVAPAKLFEGIK